MANLKSSKKDKRRSETRKARNSQKKSTIRTYARNILTCIKDGKKEEAAKLFIKYTSVLDKAAKINILHKKNASRNKSRMAKRISSIK